MSTIRFIGHTGELKSLGGLHPKTMFVLDANTVLNISRHVDSSARLDDAHMRLLRETRRRVHLQWSQRIKFIPVEAVFAIMELTKQNLNVDYSAYEARYLRFLADVYNVHDVDPQWIRDTYEPMEKLTSTMYQSIGETLQVVMAVAPTSGRLDQREVLHRVDDFLNWMVSERDRLAMIGGPLLYLAIYAIAGSPEAQRFLKLSKLPKEGPEAVARNVAWDFMHWVNLDFHYHYAKYPNTVVCTSDQSLADFLLMRRNRGPRNAKIALERGNVVESYGDINLPRLGRLTDTKLVDELGLRIWRFWQRLSPLQDSDIYFGLMR